MEDNKDLTTEQKILEAAEELFVEKGFAATSTTEIARLAGCNHAMLHYYFRTKEKLFQTIFEEKIKLFVGAFFITDGSEGSFEENLRRKISAHFDLIGQNPRLPLFILRELGSKPERVSLLREAIGNLPQTLLQRLGQDLEGEIALGNIRPVTPQDLLLNILSLNAFTFASLPLIASVIGVSPDQQAWFLQHRKEEIIETIVRSLQA